MHDSHIREQEQTVGVVRALGTEPAEAGERRWVRCSRRDASVPVEACLQCRNLVSLRYDEHGAVRSLLCSAPDESAGDREEPSRPLSLPRLTVTDLMTRNVLCVRPHLSLDALTQLFLESQLKAVPVVDDGGTVLGIVSEADVQLDIHARGAPARTAEDVMMPMPVTLREDTSVTQAAALMVFEGISRIVVVSMAGTVVGVISASDILYWLAKADGFMLPPPRHKAR